MSDYIKKKKKTQPEGVIPIPPWDPTKKTPWKKCKCQVCKKCGIEVAIFRGSNRNKRRGMHNLYVFNNQLKKILK